MELAEIDYKQAGAEIGILSTVYSTGRGDGLIGDVDLAHDMALAEDSYREEASAAMAIHDKIADLQAHQTYVRKGEKAKVFTGLIEAQKAEDDERCRHAFLYRYTPDIEEYTQQRIDRYEQERTGDQAATTTRVTNGFVADLALRAVRRAERGADRAAEIAYFKRRSEQNIAVFEEHLSASDLEVFAPTRDPEPVSDEVQNEIDQHDLRTYNGDEEAVRLKRRDAELYAIFKKKLAVQHLARLLGREDISDLTRTDVEALADFIREEGYEICDGD